MIPVNTEHPINWAPGLGMGQDDQWPSLEVWSIFTAPVNVPFDLAFFRRLNRLPIDEVWLSDEHSTPNAKT